MEEEVERAYQRFLAGEVNQKTILPEMINAPRVLAVALLLEHHEGANVDTLNGLTEDSILGLMILVSATTR